MRRAKMLLLVLAVMVLTGCPGCKVIPPGEVGIKINMLGDERGVSELTLSTGWVGYIPGMTRIFVYPSFMQVDAWTRSTADGRKGINDEICFNDMEGLPFCVDTSFAYILKMQQIPAFYVKFRSDDLSLFSHGYLRNVARDAYNLVGSKYKGEQIYGDKKSEFLEKVRAEINTHISEYATMEQFGIIGEIRMPDNVKQAINAKIEAMQIAMRTQTEILTAKAAAEKKIAEAYGFGQSAVKKAEGEAKANQLLAASITPTLLQWENLQIQKIQASRWNGQTPMVTMGGQGVIPMLQLPKDVVDPKKRAEGYPPAQ